MINQIQEAFPHIIENVCLNSINDKHTFIFEDKEQNKGIIVSDKDNYHLHIENKTKYYFHFLQNDDCVMKNIKGGQCDYVIFNNQSIYFTEIKIAAGHLANHRKNAYDQIENTFKFYSREINFVNDYIVNALVCFPTKRRIVKPSESTKKKEFKIKYQIHLQIGNYILFD